MIGVSVGKMVGGCDGGDDGFAVFDFPPGGNDETIVGAGNGREEGQMIGESAGSTDVGINVEVSVLGEGDISVEGSVVGDIISAEGSVLGKIVWESEIGRGRSCTEGGLIGV